MHFYTLDFCFFFFRGLPNQVFASILCIQYYLAKTEMALCERLRNRSSRLNGDAAAAAETIDNTRLRVRCCEKVKSRSRGKKQTVVWLENVNY